MSDSSNPSVNRPDDDKEPGPVAGSSSASSLGAPQPDDETGDSDNTDESTDDDSNEFAVPDPDIQGDPDQVT